jgi:hypothetical protein
MGVRMDACEMERKIILTAMLMAQWSAGSHDANNVRSACSLELSAAYFQSASSVFSHINQPTVLSAAYFQPKRTSPIPTTPRRHSLQNVGSRAWSQHRLGHRRRRSSPTNGARWLHRGGPPMAAHDRFVLDLCSGRVTSHQCVVGVVVTTTQCVVGEKFWWCGCTRAQL